MPLTQGRTAPTPLVVGAPGAIGTATARTLAAGGGDLVRTHRELAAFSGLVAAEVGRSGVRADSIGFGVIDSALRHDLTPQGAYTEEYLDAARRAFALRRSGTAEDTAQATRFPLSPEAGWISGQLLNVDGGCVL